MDRGTLMEILRGQFEIFFGEGPEDLPAGIFNRDSNGNYIHQAVDMAFISYVAGFTRGIQFVDGEVL